MQIHVVTGDLTAMPVDAVVNPANSQALMVGGVAGALKSVGGDRIEQEARASAPIAVGAAVVTGGGNLAARHVIHAPTTEERGVKVGVENVRRATRAALLAAAVHGFDTVAIPAMGSGVGAVPLDEATRAMVDELRAHRQPRPGTVYLVGLNNDVVAAFEQALNNALSPT